MKRLRVLIVSEPMEYGVLSYLQCLFEGLDRSRWEPALAYSPQRMAPQAKTLVSTLIDRGIRVRQLPFQRGIGIGDARAAAGLLDEINAFRPDLLHLHSTKAGLIGRSIAATRRMSVLYTPHGTSWHYTGRLVGRVQLALERALRWATDVLLSVCDEEAGVFVREVGFPVARVRVIRNGVRVPDRADLAAARARARAELGLAPHDIWLVFVGRLTHEKGLDVLLRALHPRLGVAGLMVVGDGAERSRLSAAAAQAQVPVRFFGYHEDVSTFLAAADLFVQPSRSEGLPFTVLEAMAHGLPVVCSSVGGIAAAVGGCGALVPPDEPATLGECVRMMACDTARRFELGQAGRARVTREFGIPTMMAALHDAYDEAYRHAS